MYLLSKKKSKTRKTLHQKNHKANGHKVLPNYQEKSPCVLAFRFMRKLAKRKQRLFQHMQRKKKRYKPFF